MWSAPWARIRGSLASGLRIATGISAVGRDLARCLQPLLRELPPTARDALTRIDLDGQTHQQAANQLGISVSGMKSRVQRARRQLKDLLTGCRRVDVDRGGAVARYRPNAGACGCPGDTAEPAGSVATNNQAR